MIAWKMETFKNIFNADSVLFSIVDGEIYFEIEYVTNTWPIFVNRESRTVWTAFCRIYQP